MRRHRVLRALPSGPCQVGCPGGVIELEPSGPTATAQQAEPAIAPSSGEIASVAVMSGVGQIPFWRRFHVRMSSLFGGVVFLVAQP